MVHELARNLLLIDERAGSYYRNPAFLADPRAVVPSPFSAVRQRFDCALPQLIIALEILLFRWRSGRVLVNPQLYPDFNCLLDKATATCAAMMAVDAHLSLLSARGAIFCKRPSGLSSLYRGFTKALKRHGTDHREVGHMSV